MNGRIWIAAGVLICVSTLVASAAPRRVTSARKSRPVRKAPAVKRPLAAQRPAAATKAPATSGEPRYVMNADEARMAVEMMGDAYDLLLDEIHETYHTRPSVPVAATVIRKVHARMTELGWPQARYLAVNAIVMHPNHVARDEFETRAIQALRRGDRRAEELSEGQLRVATVVPLGGRCSSCHWTPGAQASKAATTWKVTLREETERD
jgi:hypothetical protein